MGQMPLLDAYQLSERYSRERGRVFLTGTQAIVRIALDQALDKASAEQRVLVLGLHGGRAENGELQAMCEMRGVAFTGSGSASSESRRTRSAASERGAASRSTSRPAAT